MRGIATAAVVVGLGVLIGTGGTAFAKVLPAKECHLARGAKVVARGAKGVVSDLTRPDQARPKLSQETETSWWACLNGVGHRWFIGRTTENPNGGNTGSFGAFRIVGNYVTFEGQWGSRYGLVWSEIYQYNLRTGHRTISQKYWLESKIVAEPVASGDSSLVVNPHGDAAWLLWISEYNSLGSVDVVVDDQMGTRTLMSYPVPLDGVPWASPVTGLAITQSTVSWWYDYEEQNAPD